MADIFLSYSNEDVERVSPLVKALEREGWSVWWDRNISAGKDWHKIIEKALNDAKCVVVAWSQQSIKSEWVFREAETGRARQVLFPVMIDHVKPPFILSRVQAARLMSWKGEPSNREFQALVRSIQEVIGKPDKFQTPLPIPLFPTSEPEKRADKPPPEPNKGFTLNLPQGVRLDMAAIPGGSFMMGSKTFEDSQPIHRVTLKPFYMGKYQVTQAQWKAVMGNNPSKFKGDNLPVETVSWDEAQEFCAKLSAMTGEERRLPTEAEWEYAARAGSKDDFCFGADQNLLGDYAWYDKNSDSKTHPVGQKKPNAWGLYDLHGNVWEWCSDWYEKGYYSVSPSTDPRGPSGGISRILRGGSWYSSPNIARAVFRDRNPPGGRINFIGFRVLCCRPPSSS